VLRQWGGGGIPGSHALCCHCLHVHSYFLQIPGPSSTSIVDGLASAWKLYGKPKLVEHAVGPQLQQTDFGIEHG
jgi:hypothetical protein